jgi:sugar phosphate isomerase/epimerase
VARFRRAIEIAKDLDAPFVRVFSFFIPDGDDPAAHTGEVLARMTALAREAETAGITLLHENEKHIYGDIPARCLEILEAVGSPALRAAWDPANFVQCGVRPHTEGYAQLRPFIAYVHVKDSILATRQVVPAGQGDGEVRETLAALRGRAIVVVIAHRLSTVNLCDRVAVMRAGQVVALGDPRELAEHDPYFREALALSASAPAART